MLLYSCGLFSWSDNPYCKVGQAELGYNEYELLVSAVLASPTSFQEKKVREARSRYADPRCRGHNRDEAGVQASRGDNATNLAFRCCNFDHLAIFCALFIECLVPIGYVGTKRGELIERIKPSIR